MQALAYALLRQLQYGRTLSGSALAHSLGLDRSALKILIEELRAADVPLRSVRGSGYRIEGGLDLLDLAALQSALAIPVDIVDECDSTNTRLLDMASCEPRLYACEVQTAGRGRRGKAWHSGLGDSLSFSLLWPSALRAQQLSGLSLAVGVACIRALETLQIEGLALKWPNDLLHARGKVGGVLIEARAGAIVIGIGINVRSAATRAAQVEQAVGDLAQIAADLPRRTVLLQAIVQELLTTLRCFEQEGFAPFRAAWQRYDAHAGQRVLLSGGETAIEGIAQGVNEDGALLLLTETGERPFFSGELSLRKAA